MMISLKSIAWFFTESHKFYWGSAASVGVSLIGGMMGDDAADSGAANAGLGEAIKTLKATDERTRTDTAPYRNLGSGAANKLSAYLGVGYQPVNTGALVTADEQGNFVPNAELYANSPEFRAAYDSGMAAHQARYGTDPNLNKGSNLSGFNSTLNKPEYIGAYNDRQKAAYEGQEGYGSLLNKFTNTDLNNDVVYQSGLKFGLDNGNKSINNRALATGKFDSGESEKALAKWGNDYGSTKANESYGRFMNDKASTYGMLSGSSNIGLNAVNTSSNAGLAVGQAIAGAQGQQGANNAAANTGSANAWSGALSGAANAFGDWWGKSGGQNPSYGSIPTYTF